MDPCAICGWPGSAAVCTACGADQRAATPLADAVHVAVLAGPQPEDFPALRPAFVAWRQKDWARMVGQCLVALGVDAPRVTPLATGHGWAFAQDSAAIFVIVDRETEELAVESPMLKLPRAQRVAAMRCVLEMNARLLGAARFCLRDDLVVLRFCDRLASLSPPKVVDAIREVATRADLFDDLLAAAFDAKMVGPDARRQHLDFASLGTPRDLPLVRRRAQAVAMPSTLPVPDRREPAREAPAAAPGRALGAAVQARLDANEALCESLRSALELLRPLGFMKDLHPATLLLVQRAILVRLHAEHGASCPGAVAMLFDQGRGALQKIWEAPARSLLGKIAASVQSDAALPPALPFALGLERVLRQRGHVDAPAAPASLPAFASALEAKQHLRRVQAELDKAPESFPAAATREILLGTMIEVGVRTALPAPTRERLEAAIARGRELDPVAGAKLLREALDRMAA